MDFRCLVFLRSDIYEYVVRDTPDRDKDPAIRLEWEDEALFEDIIRLRVATSTEIVDGFNEIWRRICEPRLDGEETFSYLLERTLARPREVLRFLSRCIEVAVNHGHKRIEAGDILHAEKLFSEDILLTTVFEIQDTYGDLGEALWAFQGRPRAQTIDQVRDLLVGEGVDPEDISEALRLLLWYDFLGIAGPGFEKEEYSYTRSTDIRRLLGPVEAGRAKFVVNPAFCAALEVTYQAG